MIESDFLLQTSGEDNRMLIQFVHHKKKPDRIATVYLIILFNSNAANYIAFLLFSSESSMTC